MSNLPAMTKDDVRASRVGAILPATIDEAITIAKTLFVSGLFVDLAKPEQAVAKIMAGAEMGIPPIAALNAFHIVKGRIMTHYTAILGGVRRAGYDYRTVEHTDDVCHLVFLKDGEEIGHSIFTREDAVRCGTGAPTANDKGMLAKYPKTMLLARAASQGARWYVPEAFNGLIVYEHSERAEIEQEAAQEEQRQPHSSAILEAKVARQDIDESYNPFADVDPLEKEVASPTYDGSPVKDEGENVVYEVAGELPPEEPPYEGPVVAEDEPQPELVEA